MLFSFKIYSPRLEQRRWHTKFSREGGARIKYFESGKIKKFFALKRTIHRTWGKEKGEGERDPKTKIRRYGITISGFIDGFSRLVFWLRAGPPMTTHQLWEAGALLRKLEAKIINCNKMADTPPGRVIIISDNTFVR